MKIQWGVVTFSQLHLPLDGLVTGLLEVHLEAFTSVQAASSVQASSFLTHPSHVAFVLPHFQVVRLKTPFGTIFSSSPAALADKSSVIRFCTHWSGSPVIQTGAALYINTRHSTRGRVDAEIHLPNKYVKLVCHFSDVLVAGSKDNTKNSKLPEKSTDYLLVYVLCFGDLIQSIDRRRGGYNLVSP